MANKTNNYKLPKPEADDFYDISEYNKTMDMLDDSLTEMDQKKLDKNGDASEAVTEFEQEILRENIESGETLSSTFGKVKKWFSEMKDVAFSGHAKDVATDAAHRFVSDVEKSNWNGKVAANGGDISETVIGSLESIGTEFPIPNQGESSYVFLGKVKKFLQDFNNFKAGIITIGKLANNGSTTSEGYALDARYGKTLFDLYSKVNSDLNNIFKITKWIQNSTTIAGLEQICAGGVGMAMTYNCAVPSANNYGSAFVLQCNRVRDVYFVKILLVDDQSSNIGILIGSGVDGGTLVQSLSYNSIIP